MQKNPNVWFTKYTNLAVYAELHGNAGSREGWERGCAELGSVP